MAATTEADYIVACATATVSQADAIIAQAQATIDQADKYITWMLWQMCQMGGGGGQARAAVPEEQDVVEDSTVVLLNACASSLKALKAEVAATKEPTEKEVDRFQKRLNKILKCQNAEIERISAIADLTV